MPLADRFVAGVWKGESRAGAVLRSALLPAAGLFRGIVSVRNALYDRGTLRSHRGPIPVVSVGNIAVGGAGKTPIAAWLARQLAHEGAIPAIVMRGYGGDEQAVHRELNPEVPVFLYPDRAAGVRAAARVGCDVAVLDDGFQHRSAARDEDVVLLAADSWRRSMALLPAGPWREPPGALRRATLVIITAKAAASAVVRELEDGVTAIAPAVPQAVVRLQPDRLQALTGGGAEALSAVTGRRVLAVAAVADPEPFFLQLEQLGARVTRRPFADHHSFSTGEIAQIREDAAAHDMLVCTLKDAVKLRGRWAHDDAPAWYVSQAVTIERGAADVAALLGRLLASRRPPTREIIDSK